MLTVASPDLVRWNEIQKTLTNLNFNLNYIYEELTPPYLKFWAT